MDVFPLTLLICYLSLTLSTPQTLSSTLSILKVSWISNVTQPLTSPSILLSYANHLTPGSLCLTPKIEFCPPSTYHEFLGLFDPRNIGDYEPPK